MLMIQKGKFIGRDFDVPACQTIKRKLQSISTQRGKPVQQVPAWNEHHFLFLKTNQIMQRNSLMLLAISHPFYNVSREMIYPRWYRVYSVSFHLENAKGVNVRIQAVSIQKPRIALDVLE